MRLKKILLGTSACVCVALAALTPAHAQQGPTVTPGGALDISVSGFARFQATGGDIDNAQLDDTIGTGLDFSNDTEVHFLVRGESDATGLKYGATIEFEADTNRSDNTDETWLFVSGGWGEVRVGDEDGVVDNSSVGAQVIAAGTGGLDGTLVDTYGVNFAYLTNTSDSTKIRYYTPTFGGFQAGISYTPNQDGVGSGSGNGDDIANTPDIEVGDVVEGGLVYEGELGGLGLTASVVGLYGDVKDEDTVGGDDYYGVEGGASVEVFGIKLAGAYLTEKVGDAERDWFNAGIGAELGPANVSINYGQTLSSDDLTGGPDGEDDLDEPYAIVLSADVGLVPGLTLAGDVAYFDNDVKNGPNEGSDDGYIGIVRLGLAF